MSGADNMANDLQRLFEECRQQPMMTLPSGATYIPGDQELAFLDAAVQSLQRMDLAKRRRALAYLWTRFVKEAT